MKIGPVSGDMLIKLAGLVTVMLGAWYVKRKIAEGIDAVGDTVSDIVSMPGRALEAAGEKIEEAIDYAKNMPERLTEANVSKYEQAYRDFLNSKDFSTGVLNTWQSDYRNE